MLATNRPMPGRDHVAQASPALRERAGQSPRESRFILDPLMDRTLDELGSEIGLGKLAHSTASRRYG